MDWKISNGLVAGKNIMSLKQEEAELTSVWAEWKNDIFIIYKNRNLKRKGSRMIFFQDTKSLCQGY